METPSPPPLASAPQETLFPRRREPIGTLLLSGFGLGLIGWAPGTLGSLGCLPVAAVIEWFWGPHVLLGAAALVFILGWVLAAFHLRHRPDVKDPQWIVIDEVAAQWAVVAVVPFTLGWYAAGFALFRLFDITKPWPVSWADRRVPGALGIMLDDLLAGLYAGGILITVRLLWLP